MDAAVKRLVRERAGNRCEYCGLTVEQSPLAPLQMEHVLPRKHHGGDEPDNLALACIDCNLPPALPLQAIQERFPRAAVEANVEPAAV